ncbi:hypothetical protein ACF0H5_017074 [Mactra antiquata]
MERCVYKYLYNYIIDNNLLYSKQAGFLSGQYQLLDLYHQIVQSYDKKNHTCIVFCDISKAFDRVWHKGLLFKMQQLGIQGSFLKWLENYLNDRQQQVCIGQAKSTLNYVKAGVPQGSVLGPLLFLVYVNDITENLVSVARLFADDSSLSSTISSVNELENILNHDLNIISQWSKQWLVSFNPVKTEVLYYGNGEPPNLIFDDTVLIPVEKHKHLGVTLDSNCKWSTHINTIISSSSKILGILRKIKYTVSRKALNQIYLSFLRPQLEYACVVWDNCNQSEKNKLEKIQIEAARIVTGLTRSVSLRKIYNETGWLTLAERRSYQKLLLMFKIKKIMVPNDLISLFQRADENPLPYNLRSRNDFVIPQQRTTLFSNSFIPSAINSRNSLPEQIRNSPTISKFKHDLLDSLFKTNEVPTHFLIGSRRISVIHTRLRNNCINLKSDLHLNHISDTDECPHCKVSENAEHFFKCKQYENQRIQLFIDTRQFHPSNVNILLFGDTILSQEQNKTIILAVHKYIKTTKRFDE